MSVSQDARDWMLITVTLFCIAIWIGLGFLTRHLNRIEAKIDALTHLVKIIKGYMP